MKPYKLYRSMLVLHNNLHHEYERGTSVMELLVWDKRTKYIKKSLLEQLSATRNSLRRFVKTVFVYVPKGYYYSYTISNHRRYLVNDIKENKTSAINNEQYVVYKNQLDQIDLIFSKISRCAAMDVKEVPLCGRALAKQIKELSSTLVTYKGWIESRISKMDFEKFNSHGGVFLHKTEDELWAQRNKVYKYWM